MSSTNVEIINKSSSPSTPLAGPATLPLHGGAGVYTVIVKFNGIERHTVIDTGSGLSWCSLESGDSKLPEHETGRMEDGDGYLDGQHFSGVFRYGDLSITPSLILPSTAMLIVSDSIKYTTRSVIGMNPRQGRSFMIEGVRHPGDLSRRIICELPAGRKVLGLEINRLQAHDGDMNGTNVGPSNFIFGGLHAPPSEYTWTQSLPRDCVDWIIPVSFGVIGPTGERGRYEDTFRVLVDTGCSHFKVPPELGSKMEEIWGFHLITAECNYSGEQVSVDANKGAPERSLLKDSALEMTLESQTFRVKAKDLILKDNPDVVDGDRQCNRILMNDADDSVLPFDCTAGMAFLAGFKAVAFDYEKRRVGFLAR